MRRWPESLASHPSRGALFERGAAIVNARGIPGTLGFVARTRHDDRPVLVSSHHVLFAEGAREGDPVWLAHGASHGGGSTLASPPVAVGRLAYGRAGVVRIGAVDVWVDAAVATLDDDILVRSDFDIVDDAARHDDLAVSGDIVSKRGAATASTFGRIADVDYLDRSQGSRRRARPDAPAQLLVRSASADRPFAAAGDSGAAVRGAHGAIVGLLWGVTPRGDGVACPIAAVLHVLHLRVARLVPCGARLAATLRDR